MVKELVKISEKRRPTGESRAEKRVHAVRHIWFYRASF